MGRFIFRLLVSTVLIAAGVLTLGAAYRTELFHGDREPDLNSQHHSRAFTKAEEPSERIVSSGSCVVPVCANVDLGDYFLRVYAPSRTHDLKFIPKGACRCSTARTNPGGFSSFNGLLAVNVVTADGRKFPNVSVIRVQSDTEKGHNRTSWRHYEEVRARLVRAPGYRWRDDNFSEFEVFEHRRVSANPNLRQLYFVPLEE